MLIGIDATRANLLHKTGVEWYSYYLIRWLAKIDSTNEYILYTNKPLIGGLLNLSSTQHTEEEEKEEKIEFEKGYQILKCPHNNFRAKVLDWPVDFLWTQGRLSLEMIIHRPDVLFVPSHVLPIIHPRKSIVTIHDIAFEKNRNFYDSGQIIPKDFRLRPLVNSLVRILTLGKYGANTLDYLKWSTNYSLKHASKIIAISNFTKKDLLELDPKKEDKIKVVYHGYNKSLFKKIDDKEEIKQVLHKYGVEEPYLFFVGRIESKKNISGLIEAYAILKENKSIKEKLVLAGKAGHGYDEVNYMIREFGVDDDVILLGWVEELDMPYFYNGATAFVLPSNYEGFGIPLLQAMASGTPIVASDSSVIPEVVGEAGILFNVNNPESMSEAMEEVITNKEKRDHIIKIGEERVKNFSWEKCARETLKELVE